MLIVSCPCVSIRYEATNRLRTPRKVIVTCFAYTYSVATFRKVRDLEGEGLAAVKSYAANFKEQVKSLLAQRVENYKSDVESLTGTAPLELADNGDHFSYPGVIDGERDELPL